jgi:energy-converting hydrogenase Eha subunit F
MARLRAGAFPSKERRPCTQTRVFACFSSFLLLVFGVGILAVHQIAPEQLTLHEAQAVRTAPHNPLSNPLTCRHQ